MEYPVLNEQEALNRIYDKEFLKELLREFSNMKELNPEDLDSFLEEENYEQMELISHSLKGVAGNLSLTGIYLAATDLNDALTNSNFALVKGLCQELMKEIERFREFLPGYLRS